MDGPTYTSGHEGRKYDAYLDQNGVPTIGIGFTDKMWTTGAPIVLGLTITDGEIDAEWAARYPSYEAGAAADLGPAWDTLDLVRRAALTDCAYQDGPGNSKTGVGGLAGYHKMLAAVRVGDWQAAHDQRIDSLDESMTPARCEEGAMMLKTGEWPDG